MRSAYKKMKSTPVLLNATFLYLFVLLATTLPSTRAKNLMDIDGNPIVSGLTYYILPVDTGSGGGPTLSKTGDDSCPLTVVQDADSGSTGLPVRMTDNGGIFHVEERMPVLLEFVGKNVPSCVPSHAMWAKVGQNVKMVEETYAGFTFRPYSSGDEHIYYIAECTAYWDCRLVTSVDKTLLVANSKNASPWVVKFKRAYSNSIHDSWSIV